MGCAGIEVRHRWLDVSHRVTQTLLAVTLLNRSVALNEVLVCGAVGYAAELKAIIRRDRAALAQAEAASKRWSARWKGIEAAITRFCAEHRITTEQLFAIAGRRPAVIDEAREDLDAKVRADRRPEAAAYQIFDIVPGQYDDEEG